MSVRLPDSVRVSALLPRETKPSFFQGKTPTLPEFCPHPRARERARERDERKVDARIGRGTKNVLSIPPRYTLHSLK